MKAEKTYFIYTSDSGVVNAHEHTCMLINPLIWIELLQFENKIFCKSRKLVQCTIEYLQMLLCCLLEVFPFAVT